MKRLETRCCESYIKANKSLTNKLKRRGLRLYSVDSEAYIFDRTFENVLIYTNINNIWFTSDLVNVEGCHSIVNAP